MSRTGQTIGPIDWAGGKRTFRMGNNELILLQDHTDCGPAFLLRRLAGDEWRVQDISHVIRLGLMGGGMTPDEAQKLVANYVEARPPAESLPLAYAVLAAGVVGAPDESPGEAEGEDQKGESSTTSPTENSAGA